MILSKIIFHSLIFKSKQLETTPIMIPGDRINTLLCIYSIKYTVHPYRKYYAVIRKDEEALWGTLIGNDMWFAKWDGKWEKEYKYIHFCYSETLGADTRKQKSSCQLCEWTQWCNGVVAGWGESRFCIVLLSSLNMWMYNLRFKRKQITTNQKPVWI